MEVLRDALCPFRLWSEFRDPRVARVQLRRSTITQCFDLIVSCQNCTRPFAHDHENAFWKSGLQRLLVAFPSRVLSLLY